MKFQLPRLVISIWDGVELGSASVPEVEWDCRNSMKESEGIVIWFLSGDSDVGPICIPGMLSIVPPPVICICPEDSWEISGRAIDVAANNRNIVRTLRLHAYLDQQKNRDGSPRMQFLWRPSLLFDARYAEGNSWVEGRMKL